MRRFRLLLVLADPILGGCVEQPPKAVERGTLIAEQPVVQAGENTGVGAAVGVVLGVTAGAVIGGGGLGQAVGAVVGSAVGGTAGAAAETAMQPRNGIAYTIALRDGRVVTIMQHRQAGTPMLSLGTMVAVTTQGAVQHVDAAGGA